MDMRNMPEPEDWQYLAEERCIAFTLDDSSAGPRFRGRIVAVTAGDDPTFVKVALKGDPPEFRVPQADGSVRFYTFMGSHWVGQDLRRPLHDCYPPGAGVDFAPVRIYTPDRDSDNWTYMYLGLAREISTAEADQDGGPAGR